MILDFCYSRSERKSEMEKWQATADAYQDEYSQHESESLEFQDKRSLEKWFLERIKRWTNNWTTNLELETRTTDNGYVQSALNIKIQEIND